MSRPWVFAGIDPGLDGGIVSIADVGGLTVSTQRVMPVLTPKGGGKRVLDEASLRIALLGLQADGAFVAIEDMSTGAPSQRGAQSALTMGINYGIIIGMLRMAQISFIKVRAATWQKAICPGSGDPKLRSVQAAQRLFPNSLDLVIGKHPHDGLADAACLAVYARQWACQSQPGVTFQES